MQAWSNRELTRAVIGLIENSKRLDAQFPILSDCIRVMNIDSYGADRQGITYFSNGIARIDPSTKLEYVFGQKIYIPNFVRTPTGGTIEINEVHIDYSKPVEIEAEWLKDGASTIRLNNKAISFSAPKCKSMNSITIQNANSINLPNLISLNESLKIYNANSVILSCGFNLLNAGRLKANSLKLVAGETSTIPTVPDKRNTAEDIQKLYIPHACLALNINDGTTLNSILQTYFGLDTEIIGY